MVNWNPVRLSAMQYRHLALGATMVDEGGWQRPTRYTTSQEELDGLRRGVGLCDVSPIGKLYIEGVEIDSFLLKGCPGAQATPVGQATRHDLLNGDGSLLDQVLLCRLAQDELFIVTSAEKVQAVAAALERSMEGCVHQVDQTSALAAMSVAGPHSRETLSKLTELDLSPEVFHDLSSAQASMALVHATVLRADCGGQECYQVYVGRDLGEFLWDAIMEAGHEWNITPFGVEALRRLQEGGQ